MSTSGPHYTLQLSTNWVHKNALQSYRVNDKIDFGHTQNFKNELYKVRIHKFSTSYQHDPLKIDFGPTGCAFCTRYRELRSRSWPRSRQFMSRAQVPANHIFLVWKFEVHDLNDQHFVGHHAKCPMSAPPILKSIHALKVRTTASYACTY